MRNALLVGPTALAGLWLLGGSFAAQAFTTPADGWSLDSGVIDPTHYAGITVANGVIGLLSSPQPFGSQQTLIAGSYEQDAVHGVSVIVRSFDFLKLNLAIDGEPITRVDQVTHFRQSLDMKRAVLTTNFDYQDKVSIACTVRALRQLPYDAMAEFTIAARRPVTISVASQIEPSSMLKDARFVSLQAPQGGSPLLAASASGSGGRLTVGAAQTFLFDATSKIAPSIGPAGHDADQPTVRRLAFNESLTAGKRLYFALVGATITSAQATDPLATAQRLTISAAVHGAQELIDGHEHAWAELWKSDIDIEGDVTAQRNVRSMLYHLYSFARAGSGYSVAPMGLSNTGYSGHIFWDAELWMFPPLLALQPQMAKSMLDYRYARLSAARHNAFAHGYVGAMFPWESAGSGDEDTPVEALTGPLELHISADIGIAAWNYYRVTQDRAWLRDTGFPLIRETADFWASLVTRRGPGHYDIRHVVGADEFAANVDNDAFTNAAARENLRAATAAAKVLGIAPDPGWDEVRDNIPVLRMSDGVTREHAAYHGEQIKQADVILLGYPLKANTDPLSIRRDLDYYGARTYANGPAMTQSIAAILYERLGEPGRAYGIFKAGLEPNQRPPFAVIAESADSANPYFATGAGGFLQSMLYGFAGLDITDQGLVQIPTHLPGGWTSLTVTGVGPQHRSYTVKP